MQPVLSTILFINQQSTMFLVSHSWTQHYYILSRNCLSLGSSTNVVLLKLHWGHFFWSIWYSRRGLRSTGSQSRCRRCHSIFQILEKPTYSVWEILSVVHAWTQLQSCMTKPFPEDISQNDSHDENWYMMKALWHHFAPYSIFYEVDKASLPRPLRLCDISLMGHAVNLSYLAFYKSSVSMQSICTIEWPSLVKSAMLTNTYRKKAIVHTREIDGYYSPKLLRMHQMKPNKMS